MIVITPDIVHCFAEEDSIKTHTLSSIYEVNNKKLWNKKGHKTIVYIERDAFVEKHEFRNIKINNIQLTSYSLTEIQDVEKSPIYVISEANMELKKPLHINNKQPTFIYISYTPVNSIYQSFVTLPSMHTIVSMNTKILSMNRVIIIVDNVAYTIHPNDIFIDGINLKCYTDKALPVDNYIISLNSIIKPISKIITDNTNLFIEYNDDRVISIVHEGTLKYNKSVMKYLIENAKLIEVTKNIFKMIGDELIEYPIDINIQA